MKNKVKVYTEKVVQEEFEVEVDEDYHNIKNYSELADYVCKKAREQNHFIDGQMVVQIFDEDYGIVITLDDNSGIGIEKL